MSLSQYGLVGLRKSWVSSHDECLLDLLIEQQNCGKTTSNLFKYEVYKTVTQKLNQKFETNVDENQIKLRYYAMKKDYGVIKALLGQPGFHWDEQKQMVAADDEVWENFIAVRRDARPYRWRSFPLYDKMSIIFEDSVVGDVVARNRHLPSRVNRTLEEVNSDPETVQVPEPATEPAHVNVDAHDSDSSLHVKNSQQGKRKSNTSGRKRSSHVEAEDNIENAYFEMPRANKTRNSAYVATSRFNKSPHVEADDNMEIALDKSPSAAMSKGMQKNVSESQCKQKKSKSAATSEYNKRPQFEAQDSIENALDESPFTARCQGVQENLSDARITYQRCLEDLQTIDELDDSEFSQAVCALKDEKNAIAFMTIRGPRRLIWLRSILN